MTMTRVSRLLAASLLLAAGACGSEGGRSFGISATGTVFGTVTFDADGSGNVSVADSPMEGVRVRLLTPVTRDTVLRATTSATGRFRFTSVPVGSYKLVVDAASLGDSISAAGFAERDVTMLPADSVESDAVLSFPVLTAAQARVTALGARVFVRGVALNSLATYSDTLLHVVDTTAALRAVRVRPSSVATGDNVRLSGRIALRDGQPVLDDVSVFTLGTALNVPAAPILSSAAAATAAAGTRDAALVRLVDVAVVDTQTVLGSLRVTVSDGSGNLVMLLDRRADLGFRPPFLAGVWTAGRRYDAVGVLVPLSPGVWALRPRSTLDVVAR
jgi:hypothetical protein